MVFYSVIIIGCFFFFFLIFYRSNGVEKTYVSKSETIIIKSPKKDVAEPVASRLVIVHLVVSGKCSNCL